jgi:hypothetical protein
MAGAARSRPPLKPKRCCPSFSAAWTRALPNLAYVEDFFEQPAEASSLKAGDFTE